MLKSDYDVQHVQITVFLRTDLCGVDGVPKERRGRGVTDLALRATHAPAGPEALVDVGHFSGRATLTPKKKPFDIPVNNHID